MFYHLYLTFFTFIIYITILKNKVFPYFFLFYCILSQRKAIGKQPNEIELFYITHYKVKNGWSSEKAQVVYVNTIGYILKLINITIM